MSFNKFKSNHGRASELAANITTAAASRNQKLIAATVPNVIKLLRQGKGLYSGKIH